MAHIEKFKMSAVSAMLNHYSREFEGTLKRDNIDAQRTRENYVLTFETASGISPSERFESRFKRIQDRLPKKVRKDAVVLSDIVITLPENVPEGDEREFFKQCMMFVGKKVGTENVVAGYVHKDETTPHIHIPFMPILDGKFNFKKKINREFYKSFHTELADYLEKTMGYRPSVVLDERDKADKALSKLDQPTYKQAKDKLNSVYKLIDVQTSYLSSLKEKTKEQTNVLNEVNFKVNHAKQEHDALVASNESLKAKQDSIKAREHALANREAQIIDTLNAVNNLLANVEDEVKKEEFNKQKARMEHRLNVAEETASKIKSRTRLSNFDLER